MDSAAPFASRSGTAPTMRELAPMLWTAQQREADYRRRLTEARQAGELPLSLLSEEMVRSRRHLRNPKVRAAQALTDGMRIYGIAIERSVGAIGKALATLIPAAPAASSSTASTTGTAAAPHPAPQSAPQPTTGARPPAPADTPAGAACSPPHPQPSHAPSATPPPPDQLDITTSGRTLTIPLPPGATVTDAITILQRLRDQEAPA